jgi:hypothetical protein
MNETIQSFIRSINAHDVSGLAGLMSGTSKVIELINFKQNKLKQLYWSLENEPTRKKYLISCSNCLPASPRSSRQT